MKSRKYASETNLLGPSSPLIPLLRKICGVETGKSLNFQVKLPEPTAKQALFIDSLIKRKVIRAGRRGGKTVGAAILAVKKFLMGRRILYAVPVADQLHRFWVTVSKALAKPIEEGMLYKNETEHVIEVPGTETRIKAKTAWNSDTLRGDYADDLILDEWQLMNEDAWELVGSPMLLDNNGDAVFIYTPRSLHSRSVSKAKDPQHASKMFAKAKQDKSGRWGTFEWTSHDNPHLSKDALLEISEDMTSLAYLMEIMAQDITEAPGALWKRIDIDDNRVVNIPELSQIVVGVDPSTTSTGNEAGIITCGKQNGEGYVLSDDSLQGSPLEWGTAAVTAYHKFKANWVVAEANQGGEMVALTIAQIDNTVPVKLVHASRGKATRAEPVVVPYQRGKIHHVGQFPALENEMVMWIPGDPSPNRMDALVWSLTELMVSEKKESPSHLSLGLLEGDDLLPYSKPEEKKLPEEFEWVKNYL